MECLLCCAKTKLNIVNVKQHNLIQNIYDDFSSKADSSKMYSQMDTKKNLQEFSMVTILIITVAAICTRFRDLWRTIL